MSEDSKKTTVIGIDGQSNKTEMTRTSGNVMGISQYNKNLMQKRRNMMTLWHMVWCERSQTYVKSSLPEGTVIKLPEEPTEAGRGVARVIYCGED